MKKVKKWTSTSSGSSPCWWAAAGGKKWTSSLHTTFRHNEFVGSSGCVCSLCAINIATESQFWWFQLRIYCKKTLTGSFSTRNPPFDEPAHSNQPNRQPLVGLEDDLLDDLGKTKTSNLFFGRSHGILTRIFCINTLKCRANYLSSSFYSYPVFCGTERG